MTPRPATGRLTARSAPVGSGSIRGGRPAVIGIGVIRAVSRIALISTGAFAAQQALRAVRRVPGSDRLNRTNFRGATVSLAGGPALAASASITAALGAGSAPMAVAALVAGGGSGAVGFYDDVVGVRPDQKGSKGFRGHLSALGEGRVTSGLVKIAGVGLSALAAAALVERAEPRRKGHAPRPRGPVGRLVNVALGAGVIAGSANLVNLLDLRPGRALKAGVLAGVPLLRGTHGGLAAGPLGVTVALLPADLDEQIMLGDTGANSLGALLGLAVVARTGPVRRAAVLAGIAALTAASERVSFTRVIASTPGLRELDALGRRNDHDAPGTASDRPHFPG